MLAPRSAQGARLTARRLPPWLLLCTTIVLQGASPVAAHSRSPNATATDSPTAACPPAMLAHSPLAAPAVADRAPECVSPETTAPSSLAASNASAERGANAQDRVTSLLPAPWSQMADRLSSLALLARRHFERLIFEGMPGLALLVSVLWCVLSHLERCIMWVSPADGTTIKRPKAAQLFMLLLACSPGSVASVSPTYWSADAVQTQAVAQSSSNTSDTSTATTTVQRRLNEVVADDWAELKSLCEAGGNDITLSPSFDASSYPGQIDFSGKSCVIRGSGQTFDMGQQGRFAYGDGSGSSLELHGLTIQNGRDDYVS